MSSTTRGRKIFPSLPHDYIRRRRAVRRITNTCLIAFFSLATAYFITRQSIQPTHDDSAV
jgi:hypothetical protein